MVGEEREEGQIIKDEHWDYYSGLPNPKWYEVNDANG